MKNSITFSKYGKTALSVIFWLLLWQLLSLWVANDLLLVGPLGTILRLFELLPDKTFWLSIAASGLRILSGYLIGFLTGVLLAILSLKRPLLEELLKPFIAFLKSVPVAAFVVLFLIWWRSNVLAVAICICIVVPQIYINTLEGLKATDKKLLEMADVHGVSLLGRLRYIYRPALRPYMESAVKVSMGMGWKSGIAAEVIGMPQTSIGMRLYSSKISLDTAGVLAWTLTIIAISFLTEKIALKLLDLLMKRNSPIENSKERESGQADIKLTLAGICKNYGDKCVLKDYDAEYRTGETYTLREVSGWGKTTLFRIISGLENSDAGEITITGKSGGRKLSYLFQEDRLCEDYNAVKNVALVCGSEKKARSILLRLLNEEDLDKAVKELSGGQKRRVAIARAYSIKSDIILLDEPFNGLDDLSRQTVKKFMEEEGKGRITIVASHID